MGGNDEEFGLLTANSDGVIAKVHVTRTPASGVGVAFLRTEAHGTRELETGVIIKRG